MHNNVSLVRRIMHLHLWAWLDYSTKVLWSKSVIWSSEHITLYVSYRYKEKKKEKRRKKEGKTNSGEEGRG